MNLQTLGTLINVDLPWNPSRLEQRLGRIKRFGQARRTVDMLNLVYHDTQDEKVYHVLSRRMKDRYDIFGGLPDTMDEAGIDVTVMLADDFGMALGEPPVSIEEQNKAIAALAKKHPDRLVAFAVVDPRRKNAVEIIERCIEEWGMKGVGEYHPDAGWAPNGKESYRLLERLQEWGVPVIAHTGLFFPPLHSKHAHPLLLDDVCSDFPKLLMMRPPRGSWLFINLKASCVQRNAPVTIAVLVNESIVLCLPGSYCDARQSHRSWCSFPSR